MDSVHHIWCLLSSQEYQDLPDGAETTLTAAEKVVIDVTHAHFWDITSVSALDKVVIKFRREGTDVEIRGMNEATRTIVDRFGVHDKPEEIEKLMGGH